MTISRRKKNKINLLIKICDSNSKNFIYNLSNFHKHDYKINITYIYFMKVKLYIIYSFSIRWTDYL